MALYATVRTLRLTSRFRRPGSPHLGQGAFLGAQRTGITIVVGASVPMGCIPGGGDGKHPHSPGCRPYLSRANRVRSARSQVVFGEESPFPAVARWVKALGRIEIGLRVGRGSIVRAVVDEQVIFEAVDVEKL